MVLEPKLRAPTTRAETVYRQRVIAQLERGRSARFTLVTAPAGYGKTTTVAQWLASSSHGDSTAWVTLDRADNDSTRLWTLIAAAIQDRGAQIARDVPSFVSAVQDDIEGQVLPRIVAAMTSRELTLVIDDFDRVRNHTCQAQIETLIGRLPDSGQLVLITRSDPALRLGRARATRAVTEIRAADLAFTVEEAETLMGGESLQLSEPAIRDLVHRCEGWPAGLYLAALTARGRPDPEEFVKTFTGSNRYIGDYLIEEVLSQQPPAIRDFILDVSVLDRFCAPLCDRLTGGHRSADILRDLERTNLFLVPLDADSTWFRFHNLFRAVARSLLEAEDPARAATMSGRAADWLQENGYTGAAVDHAIAAGRVEEAARMAQVNWFAYYDSGLVSEAERWIRAISAAGEDDYPPTVVAAAWLAAVGGVQAELDRRLGQLERLRWDDPMPDGARSIESVIAMLRGQFGYRGPAPMLSYARRAAELETDGATLWHALANSALGHALYVTGSVQEATGALARAGYSEQASSVVRIQALALLALSYDELGDPAQARAAAEASMAVVDDHSLHAMPAASLAYTALGQVQADDGDLVGAQTTMELGLAIRRRLPGLSPWPLIHHLLAMGRLSARRGDIGHAQALLNEADDLMSAFTDGMAAMSARSSAARRLIRQPGLDRSAEPELTAREVEILTRLDSPLSIAEIAGQLFISRNTAKTHVRSIFAKLGARTRVEAVRIAHDRRLI